jgi:hypothetical protein
MGWGSNFGGNLGGAAIGQAAGSVLGSTFGPVGGVVGSQAGGVVGAYVGGTGLDKISSGWDNIGKDPAGWITDDIFGQNKPGDPGNPPEDLRNQHVAQLNEMFGVGTSESAKNIKANYTSAMDRYKSQFLASMNRRAYGQAGEAMTVGAQRAAGSGFDTVGSSTANRAQLDAATQLANAITGTQAQADEKQRALARGREDQRISLAKDIIDGGDWRLAFDQAQNDLNQTDRVDHGVFMEQLGSLFGDMGSAAANTNQGG